MAIPGPQTRITAKLAAAHTAIVIDAGEAVSGIAWAEPEDLARGVDHNGNQTAERTGRFMNATLSFRCAVTHGGDAGSETGTSALFDGLGACARKFDEVVYQVEGEGDGLPQKKGPAVCMVSLTAGRGGSWYDVVFTFDGRPDSTPQTSG